MWQKMTSTWLGPRADGSPRLRVLVESADPALANSDFSSFTSAGIDVALCHGPVDSPSECPLVRGEPCVLAATADAILFGPGPHRPEVVEAARRHHGATPVVVVDGRGGLPPEGCQVLVASASVDGQISVLRRAALAGRRRRIRSSQE